MTVFGRDTLITCLQTLLFGPELARTALEVLAELQATRGRPGDRRRAGQDRPRGAARQGRAELVPRATTARSTRRRSTSSCSPRSGAGRTTRRSCASCKEPALRALEWIDELRRPRRRRVRRVPSAGRARGLDEPVVEGLGRLAALPRRHARAGADRAVRGAGLRLRREAAHGRARARGLARPRARRPARARGGGAARALRRGASGSRSAAATTRSRSTARSGRSTRSARTSATCSGAGSSRPSASTRSSTQLMGEELWSGWGVRTMSDRRRRLQPALVPQRHRLAARQLADRAGASPGTGAGPRRSGSSAGCSSAARALRLPAAGGLRRAAARGDAVPDRLPDGRAPAGVGGRHARAAAPGAARPRARPAPARARDARARGAAVVGRGSLRLSGVRAFERAWDVRVDDGPRDGSRRSELERDAHRRHRARLVPGAADRLRRDRVGRLAARRRARRRRPRRHAVRLGRLAHEGEARLGLRRGAERADRARRSPSCSTRSPATSAPDEFDVDQRPLGPARRRARRARRRRRSSTRSTGRSTATPGALYEQIAQGRAEVGLISISLNQRKPKPDLPWVANCPNALDLVALPVQAAPRRLPPLPRPDEPGQGRAPRDRGRDGGRAAAQDRRQDARAEGARVLRRVRRAAPRRPDRVPRRGHPRREGRAAPERARDALPDRVGGAVRARHDRVDGLRDAGDRDALRRRARGDRGRAAAGSSSTTTARWRPRSSEADALDPLECRRYVEERFSPERMVADYERAYEKAIAAHR